MNHLDDNDTSNDKPAPASSNAVECEAQAATRKPATRAQAINARAFLRSGGYIGQSQVTAIGHAMNGEEQQFFFDQITGLAARIAAMPKTYEQDGKGDQALVSLHYFRGGMDWFITERDQEDEQHQAFGLADLGHGGELGYISLIELTTHGVELDLYFTPQTLGEIRAKRAR